MAASTTQSRARGGRGRRRRQPMSDINVTPFIEVILVILIVFMISAPLMTVGVDVDLPAAPAAAINEQSEPVVVTVDGDGRLFVEDDEVALDVLGQRLGAIRNINADTRIFVKADQNLSYGRVMAVMGSIQSAGFQRATLVTEPAGR